MCFNIQWGGGAVKNEIGDTGSVASNSILAQIGPSLSGNVINQYVSLQWVFLTHINISHFSDTQNKGVQ